jgi:hypothetical protein
LATQEAGDVSDTLGGRRMVVVVVAVVVSAAAAAIAVHVAGGVRHHGDVPPVTSAGLPAMGPGGQLGAGQSLDDGGWTLGLERDGALVARSPGGAVVWSGGAHGHRGASLVMQADGDLVERDASGATVWRSGTVGAGSCLLGGQTIGSAIAFAHPTVRLNPVWSVSPCYAGDLSKVRTAVVGDSIVFVSQPSLEAMLRPRAAYMISGQIGWTIGQQQPAIFTDLYNPEGPARDWIVNLGTNDAIQDDTAWRSAYDAMVAQLVGQPCVLLTTVSTEADTVGHDTIAAQINAAEAATAAAHGNVHVVDWSGLVHVDSHLGQWLLPDRIHPNRAGQEALAAMYGRALDRFCHT